MPRFKTPKFSEGFPPGVVVWSRLGEFPWWPSVVVNRTEHEKTLVLDPGEILAEESPSNRMVEFFNDNKRVAVLELKDLLEYSTNVHKVNRAGQNTNLVIAACEEANAYIASTNGLSEQRESLQDMNFKLPKRKPERNVLPLDPLPSPPPAEPPLSPAKSPPPPPRARKMQKPKVKRERELREPRSDGPVSSEEKPRRGLGRPKKEDRLQRRESAPMRREDDSPSPRRRRESDPGRELQKSSGKRKRKPSLKVTERSADSEDMQAQLDQVPRQRRAKDRRLESGSSRRSRDEEEDDIRPGRRSRGEEDDERTRRKGRDEEDDAGERHRSLDEDDDIRAMRKKRDGRKKRRSHDEEDGRKKRRNRDRDEDGRRGRKRRDEEDDPRPRRKQVKEEVDDQPQARKERGSRVRVERDERVGEDSRRERGEGADGEEDVQPPSRKFKVKRKELPKDRRADTMLGKKDNPNPDNVVAYDAEPRAPVASNSKPNIGIDKASALFLKAKHMCTEYKEALDKLKKQHGLFRERRSALQDTIEELDVVNFDRETLEKSEIGPGILDLIDYMEPVSVDLRNGLVKAVNKWEDQYNPAGQAGAKEEKKEDVVMSEEEETERPKSNGKTEAVPVPRKRDVERDEDVAMADTEEGKTQ